MADIFRLELLPALHGDCLLLEYGDPDHPHRVLIDGGPIGAYPALSSRLDALPSNQRDFELLVITHVDADHIEGCLKLLNHPELATFKDIWFNGWPHVGQQLSEPVGTDYALGAPLPPGQRSAMQGMEISVRIDNRSWNAAFRGAPVFVPAAGPLPVRELPGGLRLTLLSPRKVELEKLRTAYLKALEAAEIAPEDVHALARRLDMKAAFRGVGARLRPRFEQILDSAALAAGPMDKAVANGSSIALVAEYQGRRVALLGDAHAPTLTASLARFATGSRGGGGGVADDDAAFSLGNGTSRGTGRATGSATSRRSRVRFDAIKLAHHGSAGNLDESFLDSVDCDTWLVSTNGQLFSHPDAAALHAIVRRKPGATLVFNYRSEFTAPWDDPQLRDAHGHTTVYPEDADGGVVMDLLSGTPVRRETQE